MTGFIGVREGWDESLAPSRSFDARGLSIRTFPIADTFEGQVFDPQSLHKYLYVHADPVNLNDPTGLYGTNLPGVFMVLVTALGNIEPNSGVGHHWVPQAVFNTLFVGKQISREALDVFKKTVMRSPWYRHGYDTWDEVTHDMYNQDVRTLLNEYIRMVGVPLGKEDAEIFANWIADGLPVVEVVNELKTLATRAPTATVADRVRTWRSKYVESVRLAERIAKFANRTSRSLSEKELRAIVIWKIDNRETKHLTTNARNVYRD